MHYSHKAFIYHLVIFIFAQIFCHKNENDQNSGIAHLTKPYIFETLKNMATSFIFSHIAQGVPFLGAMKWTKLFKIDIRDIRHFDSMDNDYHKIQRTLLLKFSCALVVAMSCIWCHKNWFKKLWFTSLDPIFVLFWLWLNHFCVLKKWVHSKIG